MMHINQVANLEPDLEMKLINTTIQPDVIAQKDSLIEMAIQSNREIRQAMLQDMVAESNIRIQKANYYPEISLFGQYTFNQQNNEVGTIQYGKTYGRQVGMTVRFNLFNGFNDKR